MLQSHSKISRNPILTCKSFLSDLAVDLHATNIVLLFAYISFEFYCFCCLFAFLSIFICTIALCCPYLLHSSLFGLKLLFNNLLVLGIKSVPKMSHCEFIVCVFKSVLKNVTDCNVAMKNAFVYLLSRILLPFGLCYPQVSRSQAS